MLKSDNIYLSPSLILKHEFFLQPIFQSSFNLKKRNVFKTGIPFACHGCICSLKLKDNYKIDRLSKNSIVAWVLLKVLKKTLTPCLVVYTLTFFRNYKLLIVFSGMVSVLSGNCGKKSIFVRD